MEVYILQTILCVYRACAYIYYIFNYSDVLVESSHYYKVLSE